MPLRSRRTVRGLALLLGSLLLGACSNGQDVAHPVSVQDVQSIQIQYLHGPLPQVEELHALRPGAGRRAFVRRSQLSDPSGQHDATVESVPVQRVGELLWAVSTSPWSRARGVEAVARRVRPARLLEQAQGYPQQSLAGCTPQQQTQRLRKLARGGALRAQVEGYYDDGGWTDDAPAIRVRIVYENGTVQVVHSHSQKLQMLPWIVGEPGPDPSRLPWSAPPVDATQLWSVPISQAVLRLLPADSAAVTRLGAREDQPLARHLVRSVHADCGVPAR